MRPLLAVLLAGLAGPALPQRSAGMAPVTDARPQLMVGDQPLDWWDGGPAFLLASARAVRVNLRGVFPVRSSVRGDLARAGWSSAPCNESARALCSSDVGDVFPLAPPRMPDRPWALADGWRDLGCARSGGKLLVHAEVYDITACDVWDEGLDLLFVRGTLYFRHTEPPFWEYCLLVGICVVLVRSLSFNVQVLLQPDTPVVSQFPGLLATGALMLLVALDTDAAYVTQRDRLFFWASFAFAGLYLAVYAAESAVRELRRERVGPMFNLLVAGLQLAVMRFYRTADTPYTLLLLPMLAARLWSKLQLRAEVERHREGGCLGRVLPGQDWNAVPWELRHDPARKPHAGPSEPHHHHRPAPPGQAGPFEPHHRPASLPGQAGPFEPHHHHRPAPNARPQARPASLHAMDWTRQVTALLDALFLSLYSWVAADAQGLLLVPAFAAAFVGCELLHAE